MLNILLYFNSFKHVHIFATHVGGSSQEHFPALGLLNSRRLVSNLLTLRVVRERVVPRNYVCKEDGYNCFIRRRWDINPCEKGPWLVPMHLLLQHMINDSRRLMLVVSRRSNQKWLSLWRSCERWGNVWFCMYLSRVDLSSSFSIAIYRAGCDCWGCWWFRSEQDHRATGSRQYVYQVTVRRSLSVIVLMMVDRYQCSTDVIRLCLLWEWSCCAQGWQADREPGAPANSAHCTVNLS